MRLSELKNEFGENTGRLILLGIVTFGIYFFIWLVRREKKFDELAGEKVYDPNLMIAAAVCTGLSSAIDRITDSGIVALIGDLASIAYGVLFVIIAFKIARFLELYIAKTSKIDVHLNRFLLVIFNIFYVNYFFNSLDVVEAKHNALKGDIEIEKA